MSGEKQGATGSIRIVCDLDLHPIDVQTARAVQTAIWRSWTGAQPETWLDTPAKELVRGRFRRLYTFLKSGKLQWKNRL